MIMKNNFLSQEKDEGVATKNKLKITHQIYAPNY